MVKSEQAAVIKPGQAAVGRSEWTAMAKSKWAAVAKSRQAAVVKPWQAAVAKREWTAEGMSEQAAVVKSRWPAVAKSVRAAGRRISEQAGAAEPAFPTKPVPTISDPSEELLRRKLNAAGQELPPSRGHLREEVPTGGERLPNASLAPVGIPLQRGGPAPSWQRYQLQLSNNVSSVYLLYPYLPFTEHDTGFLFVRMISSSLFACMH